MANVLVLGGTGFLGRNVCEALVQRFGAANARIVVPSRRPSRAKTLWTLPTVEVVRRDIHDDRVLAQLVRGCHSVVNLVGILHGSQAQFDRAHVELPRRLAAACRAASVRRVVHVSAIGADANAPSRYLRSKAQGEAALQGPDLDVTVLRPSVIFGAGDKFLNLFADLQSVFPVIPLAGASARFQPVWVEDVADAVVRCLDERETIGETIECCGPDVLTLKELVQLAGRCSGHVRPVFELPAPLARIQAGAMEWLPGDPLISRDNLDSMRVANVASGLVPGLQRLGIQPASVQAVAPLYLGRLQAQAKLNGWRAAVHRR